MKYVFAIISVLYLYRTIWKSIYNQQHFVLTQKYLETDLKLVKFDKSVGIFENILSNCAIKDFDENLNVGDYIQGYYLFDNPSECYTQKQKTAILDRELSGMCFASGLLSFILTLIILSLSILACFNLLSIEQRTRIEDFLNPNGKRIRELENKIYDLEKLIKKQ